MTDLLIRFILPMGLAGGLFWLLLQPMRPLLARLRAAWRKGLLLVGAALFLLPLPLLFQAGGQLGTAAPTAPVYNVGRALARAAEEPIPPAQDLAEPPVETLSPDGDAAKRALSPLQLAAGVYLSGLIACLALIAARHLLLMRRLRAGCEPVDEEWVTLQYRKICQDLELKKPPALYQSQAVASPMLVGPVKNRVILPARPMTTDQLRFALLHELCHYQNRDLPLKYGMLAVGALHWYNPAAHLLLREFADACEQSCDEAVARHLNAAERRQYATVLLDFAGPACSAMVFAFASPTSRLKARLHARPTPAACFAPPAQPCPVCCWLPLCLLAAPWPPARGIPLPSNRPALYPRHPQPVPCL